MTSDELQAGDPMLFLCDVRVATAQQHLLLGGFGCGFRSIGANARRVISSVQKEALDGGYYRQDPSEPREHFSIERDPFLGRLLGDLMAVALTAVAGCLVVWGLVP
jgi:hypothetical protein